MARGYRRYSDEDIIKYASEVNSMTQLLKRLGLKPTGGSHSNMLKQLQKLGLSCEHWTGKGWSKDKQLKDWTQYKRIRDLKPHLIKKRGHKCECCGLKEWQDEVIVLEVHHINGERTDNRIENLKLCCPNCHSLTPNWRGRKKKKNKLR